MANGIAIENMRSWGTRSVFSRLRTNSVRSCVPGRGAATVAMNEEPDFPKQVNEIYRGRRDALVEGLARVGWEIEKPKGTMFVWAPIPEPYKEMGSLAFSSFLVEEAKVATSPGVGFGPTGDGFVRFALIENEQRIGQAIRGIKKALPELAP